MTTETIEEKANFDTECDILGDEKLYLGDLVRLRSGGPVMTINRFNGDDHAECTWFVDRENVGRYTNPVQSHEFAVYALQRVGGKDSGSTAKDVGAFKIPGVYKIVEPDATASVHVWGKGSEKIASGLAEQLRQRPVTVTRFADGVKTVTSTCVQVEPGQSVAEVAEVGKGRPVVIGSNGELIKPLTRAEEIELRFQQFAEIKASPESVK